jgi:hypothetical protein
VAGVFEYFGGAANKIMGETIPVSRPEFDFTPREPIGVVGLIVPWNFPAMPASWKLGPALAAGNTCILKSARRSCDRGSWLGGRCGGSARAGAGRRSRNGGRVSGRKCVAAAGVGMTRPAA